MQSPSRLTAVDFLSPSQLSSQIPSFLAFNKALLLPRKSCCDCQIDGQNLVMTRPARQFNQLSVSGFFGLVMFGISFLSERR